MIFLKNRRAACVSLPVHCDSALTSTANHGGDTGGLTPHRSPNRIAGTALRLVRPTNYCLPRYSGGTVSHGSRQTRPACAAAFFARSELPRNQQSSFSSPTIWSRRRTASPDISTGCAGIGVGLVELFIQRFPVAEFRCPQDPAFGQQAPSFESGLLPRQRYIQRHRSAR